LLAAKVTAGEITRLTADYATVTKNAAHKIPGDQTISVLLARAQVRTPSAAQMKPGEPTSFVSATVKNIAAHTMVITLQTTICALAIHHCIAVQVTTDATMCTAPLLWMLLSAVLVKFGRTTRIASAKVNLIAVHT